MGRASVAYTNKDYESLRRELLARVPQLTDRWTDFNASDLGVVLLELFCGIGDMLAYYLDAQAAEAFLPTALQRQNVTNLCKLIGYRLDGPVAATTSLRFSTAAPLEEDLLIPVGTMGRALLDDGQVDFETASDAVLPHGMLYVDAPARQGARKSQTLTGTGTPWQRLELSGKNVAQGSLRVSINDCGWTEIPHFQASGADDRHFVSATDGLDVMSISFGDGRHGRVPAAGESIEVSWLETLGADGNLAPDLVHDILSPVTHDGMPVRLTVTNTVPATGGASRESLDFARAQAPAELRTLWKAVTKEDYQALAVGFPGVAKARVLDANDCAGIRYYNVHIAIAPEGGGIASPLLKQELTAFLEARKVITVEFELFDPIYRPIDIDVDVYLWAGESEDTVRGRIEQGLADFFAFENVDFDQDIHFSDVVALMDGIRGVSHVHLHTPANDVILNCGEIPALGQVRLRLRRAS
ncbi:MAG TPA: baseplate J/gp47 family protein [Candidatus Hydrogenedentes bacterium]|nr:baseplate J/gp47 family protein [Candidatus Hydrogenedentota bacterium]HPG66471.1 baseplate J/gp47 family protein [Candidatus Hydrogenedentota bacterium]